MNRPVSGVGNSEIMDHNFVGMAALTLPNGHHCRGSAWVYVPAGKPGFGVFTVCWGDPRQVMELGKPVILIFDSGRETRIVGRQANIIRLEFVVDETYSI